MVVCSLLLAAVGFGLLVTALLTGTVVWAWVSIVVCALGIAALAYALVAPSRAARRASESDVIAVARSHHHRPPASAPGWAPAGEGRRFGKDLTGPDTLNPSTTTRPERGAQRRVSRETQAMIRPSPGSLRKNGPSRRTQ